MLIYQLRVDWLMLFGMSERDLPISPSPARAPEPAAASTAETPEITEAVVQTSPASGSVEPAAGPPPGPPAKWVIPPTPGEVITSEMTGNTYTMGARIGEGHFGLVFSAVDVWGNSLAVKVMKPLGSYEKVKESTEAEFRKLLLLRHPNITYLFDAFEYRDTFYLITERCNWSLAELISQEWFDGRIWVKGIARCLLQAVHYIHLNGYCHQDIHPGNMFAAIARDELGSQEPQQAQQEPAAIQFKLGDLGVAKLFEEIDGTNTRNLAMLPPEVLDSSEFGPMDPRIDIYHCGLLLLQVALSKELQFTPDEIKGGKPKELASQLQPPLNFALEKALRRHVAFRTANAMELWRDLSSPELPEQPKTELPQPEQLELPEASPSAGPGELQAPAESPTD
jgi:serine/threonine protein kinase